MSGYIGSAAVLASSGAERKKTYSITGATTSLTGLNYTVGQVHVFHNGVRLVDGTDFTATNGNSITLTNAAESGDEVVVLSYAGYQVSDTVSASQGGTFSNSIDISGTVTADGLTVDGGANISGVSNANLQITSTGGNSYQLRTDTNDAFIYQANRGKPTVKFAYGGDISFYEDTGTTAKFFWDASAESLGIGTSSIDYTSAGRTVVHIEGSSGALLAMEDTGAKSYFFQSGNDLLLENDTSTGSMIFGTNSSTERMRIDSSGNLLVGTATNSSSNIGVTAGNGGLITATRTGNYSAIFNRKTSDGDIVQLRKNGSTVGSIGTYGNTTFIQSGSGASYSGLLFNSVEVEPTKASGGTGGDPRTDNAINLGSSGYRFKDLYLSGDVFADGREQLNLLNAKDMVATDDYNSSTRANSIIYQNGIPINSASNYNGMTLYLSSYGLGGTHDDPTNERALQLYAGDTDESGVYLRVKQGTSGWHRWKSLQTDWAALFGPSSYYGTYQSNWSNAVGNGYSMTASTSNRGITINETGYYQCHAWNRSAGGDAYVGIAVDGNRTALDSRGDSVWGHDHQDYGGSWTHSFYTGILNAGEKITAGSPSNTSTFQYLPHGYSGALVITRLS